MNIRQQKYKQNRLKGMSKVASAIAAGYSHATAYHHVNDVEKRVNMSHFLEAQGLTDKALAEFAHQGLNATKVIGYLHNYKKSDDGKVERAEPDEVISNEFVEVPDWAVRHKYFDTILRLMKKIDEKPLVDNSVHNHYVFFSEIIKKSRELCPAFPSR